MVTILVPAFLLFVLLLTKHFWCDFVWQSTFMVLNKGKYGHLGGVLHAGLHVLFSALILFPFLHDIQKVIWIVALEFAIHYHIDWFKVGFMRKRNLTDHDHLYWVATGLDQYLHHLTYALMIVLALG